MDNSSVAPDSWEARMAARAAARDREAAKLAEETRAAEVSARDKADAHERAASDDGLTFAERAWVEEVVAEIGDAPRALIACACSGSPFGGCGPCRCALIDLAFKLRDERRR